MLKEITLPEDLSTEEQDQMFERHVSGLTEFAAHLWIMCEVDEIEARITTKMQHLIDSECVKTGLTEEQVG